VNPNITPANLAAVDPGPPTVSNGIATKLANLSNGSSTADTVNGMSYTDYYSSVASDIGAQQSSASTAQQTQTQLVTQAQNMRAQISGVSLNDQAADLLQFQQAYEASSRMISVINDTTQFLLQTFEQMQG
jgi:flagellar hook-associated protein 1 FlgK